MNICWEIVGSHRIIISHRSVDILREVSLWDNQSEAGIEENLPIAGFEFVDGLSSLISLIVSVAQKNIADPDPHFCCEHWP